MNEENKVKLALSFGNQLIDTMTEMESFSHPSFKVEESSVIFTLSEEAGILAGTWTVTVRKDDE